MTAEGSMAEVARWELGEESSMGVETGQNGEEAIVRDRGVV
jgi:hypothetical protein